MCGNIVLTLFSLLLLINTASGQSHGLQFLSHEVVQEKRTSLDLTPDQPLCLENDGEISFDMNFRPGHEIYFGYIVRIISSGNQNIDIVYNQRLEKFNFIIGEAFSGVFEIDSARLYGAWNSFAIRFNEKTSEAAFYLNNKFICKGKAKFSSSTCYRVCFGANHYEGFHTVDIPPMNVKDIRIKSSGKLQLHFPLQETEGNEAQDLVRKQLASVKNPTWIKPRHQNWQPLHSFQTVGAASVAFDSNQELLYIVADDSLYQLSVRDAGLTGIALSKKRDTLPPGNQSVFDERTNSLYNFYIDQQIVSRYDPATRSWDINFTPSLLTVYWHANKFLSAFDSSLYIIGGYGQLTYKNTVQRYHFPTRSWQTLQPKGEPFMPRYLAGLGVNVREDTAFIIGGYGSATGDQTINPKHNYDLMAFSLKDRAFHKIYRLKEPSTPLCFANNLIIDGASNEFYALTYPNDRFNSVLQLIKGSLKSPVYTLVGDSIPYSFYDIKSFADLYYAPVSKKLLAVTLYTEKNNITSVKVYTIDFPPNELLETPAAEDKTGKSWIYAAALTVLIAALASFLWYRKRTGDARNPNAKAQEAAKQELATSPVALPVEITEPVFTKDQRSSAIFLFGQFEVFDKEGLEITNRFTPLIRELFLLIVIYTFKEGKGISSEQLYDLLWSDKPVKDARNNFSVNIVKLKHILEKVGDCQITKESGRWKIEILDNSMSIDFQKYVILTSAKPVINKPFILELLSVIGRGGFLPTVHYTWLDDIKSEIASRVIDLLLNFLQLPEEAREPELVVRVANCIFFFDQLNEEALVYKCRSLIVLGRHGIAKEAYLKFAKEYAENYGHPFERSFADITQ
jgi:hypothetical protein